MLFRSNPDQMQKKTLHALPRQRAVELEVAVLVAAQQRVDGVREVDADLVARPVMRRNSSKLKSLLFGAAR